MPVDCRWSWDRKNPGNTIHLQVMRDGKNVTIPVTLEAMGSRDKSGKEIV